MFRRCAAVFLAPFVFAQPPKTTHVYKTADGLPIHADVYRGSGAGLRPAVLWIHGGALIMGHRGQIRAAQLQRYLDAGLSVVSIDYRLAPETKLDGILSDLADSWRWLRHESESLGIDRDRIAVVGHSAGGYLTLAAGYLLDPPPRALVSFYDYGDVAGDWYAKPDAFYSRQPAVPKQEAYASVASTPLTGGGAPNQRSRFYLYCRQQGLWPIEVAGYDPLREPGAFDRFCPLRNVTPRYPPTLLLHGDADTDVPFEQSELMASELRRQGVPHEFIRVSGGPHGFDGRMTDPPTAALFDRAVEFLTQRLGAKR